MSKKKHRTNEQEKSHREQEFARQLVCETCLYNEQCSGTFCLIGDEECEERINRDIWGFYHSDDVPSSGVKLCDAVINIGISDFLKVFPEKKDAFIQMNLSESMTNEHYIVTAEIFENTVVEIGVINRCFLSHEYIVFSDIEELKKYSFPKVNVRITCNITDRKYI